MSVAKIDQVINASGTTVLNLQKMAQKGYYSKQIITQIDTTGRSSTTTWTLGPTFTTITGILGKSLLHLTYHVPMRNDSTSWGGGYIEPQVSFNSGTWQSLGSCGYDGGVMSIGNAVIGSYYQTILLDPGITTTFTAQFRFYFRSYDGTVLWNSSHDINAVSGAATATAPSGDNGNQHYMHLIVEELARYN
jgi:hypothetical protein